MMSNGAQSLDDLLAQKSPEGAASLIWIREQELDPEELETFRGMLQRRSLRPLIEMALRGGESLKTFDVVQTLWNRWTDLGIDRGYIVLTTGGGALSDAVGFAASTFKRGLRVAHMPTTSLAMSDAAWGGKTGINLGHFKNQVGTFHSPEFVFIHPTWLNTLDEQYRLAGWAELLKHVLLSPSPPPRIPHDLRAWPPQDRDEWQAWQSLLQWSAKAKMSVVDRDPFEKGERCILNLGHTTAHAIEGWSSSHHRPWLHGEAVALGLAFAIYESQSPGLINGQGALIPESTSRLADFPQTWLAYLVACCPRVRPDADDLWPFMVHDKKNKEGLIQDIAWRGMGIAHWPAFWEKRRFEATWNGFLRSPFNNPL
ncbi:MAG: 3-dehydroquinate synthase [Bacteroidetes bacterium]|nr:3-dehydroquinate synthase [Bacteroidota bacterium]MDA0904483.1 3-dehydroquinate synthase [Bacteroidota bacterium]MDA1241695.1 3-dehydroquinate synthase [Bacteroidota bacterium]